MTGPMRPTDEELSQRIRRSMDHYTFDRPLPGPHDGGRAAAWRWSGMLAAAAAGALVALVAVALVGWPRAGMLGSGTPSSSPIAMTAAASPSESLSTASPRPEASEVGRTSADRTCLADPGEIPAEWLRPGESKEAVRDRLGALSLVHADQRPHAARFLYADDRFVINCQIDRRADGSSGSGIVRGIREDHGGGLEYSSGSAYAGGEIVDGMRRPADMCMTGTAAPHFVRVEVGLSNGDTVEAWLGDGLWLAWWNEPVDAVEIRGYDADGDVTTVRHELSVPRPIEE